MASMFCTQLKPTRPIKMNEPYSSKIWKDPKAEPKGAPFELFVPAERTRQRTRLARS